jgi:F-type H+-transporting ATPase subunit b
MAELFVPAINFSMLVGLLGYFVWPVFKRSVAERRESIRKHSEDARIQKLDAEKKFRDFEAKLASFEQEARAALDRATRDAEAAKKATIQSANESAERLRQEAELTISANVKEIMDELRGQMVRASVDRARAILQEKISKELQSQIVKEYVEKVQ